MRLSIAAALAALVTFVPTSAALQDCGDISVGFVPLNDLFDGAYAGQAGGLYPGGAPMRPPLHDADGLQQASLVVPRNALGEPSPLGSIVLLSIGMSNTSQEFSAFLQQAQGDPELNPRLVLVNGAQGGQPAEVIADPDALFWDIVDLRLAQAGVTPMQVQAVWLKQANAAPTAPFPEHAHGLEADLVDIVRIIRDRYPYARLTYLSSRIYAGYATTPLNPEPWAYEGGFSAKWLIERQVFGDPLLSFDPTEGPVVAPWLAWGPYLWADGLVPRSDGLVWKCTDVQPDGTHPSASGADKVAGMLMDFFKTDATAKTWFLAGPQPVCGPRAIVDKYGPATGGPNGVTQLVSSIVPVVPSLKPVVLHAFGAPAHAPGAFAYGFAPLAPGDLSMFGGWVLVEVENVVPRVTSLHGKANLVLGPVPDAPGFCGTELFAQFVVKDPDSPGGFDLTRGLQLRAGH